MNNTKLVALASIVAITAFMIAAATVIPGHDAQARKVRVGNTRSTAIQAADNHQSAAAGAGAQLNTFANAPINTQTQVNNAGSTGAG
jgi:hypothetical protein